MHIRAAMTTWNTMANWATVRLRADMHSRGSMTDRAHMVSSIGRSRGTLMRTGMAA